MAALGLPVEGLEEQFGEGYVLAVAAGGERVGVGGVETYGRDGLLRSVGVVEARRGEAIGRAIVEERLAWARDRGLRAVYLLTETAPVFFERLGFRHVPRESFPPQVQASKEFSDVCPASAASMKLEL
jgi:amino-acid N-acetyltransferase